MDSSLINLLRADEEMKDFLQNCKDNSEAWNLLVDYEKNLDEEITNLSTSGLEAQKLLDELHKYNNMKDVTQSIIGLLANIQGVTVAKIHKDYDLPVDS